MKRVLLLIMLLGLLPLISIAGGGPDDYGYTWKDTNDPGGPAFNWIDITAVGTPITALTDDNSFGPIPMGMDFHYYWSDYAQLKIGSNGWLSFDNVANISHCFPGVPEAGGSGDNILAPLMGDLVFEGAGNTGEAYYFHDAASGRFIVSFINVPFWQFAVPPNPAFVGSNTFQVILDNSDSSITYQYETVEAAIPNNTSCVTDVVVGIENLTGSIGLEVSRDVMPASNYAVKFYYPDVVTLDVPDVAPSWNQYADNKAFFALPDTDIMLEAAIANTGNVNITSNTGITASVLNPTGLNVYTGQLSLNSLALGQTVTVPFAAPLNLSAGGQYTYEVATNNGDDINPSNNILATEIEILDITDPNGIPMTYSKSNAPTGSIGWSGNPGEGAGIFMQPPVYPINIQSVDMYMTLPTTGTPPAGFTVIILADDGPNGTPGTQLASQSLTPNDFTPDSWVSITLSAPVAINSGGFYVGYLQDGANINLGTETASPISRQTYEILSNQWGTYRSATAEDFMIRVNIENTFLPTAPTAVFSFDATNEPEVVFTDLSTDNPTSWTWDFGDGASSSNQNPTYTYALSGSYNVCLTVSNAGGSNQTCQTVVIDFLSTNNISKQYKTTVFPNPFTTQTFIELTGPFKPNLQLNLYNILGEQIKADYTVKNNGIILRNNYLTQGTYFFEIISKKETLGKGKVIVQ